MSEAAAEAEALIGKVLAGRYELTRVLGAGGMGVVLEARQLAVDRKVAVKLLQPGIAANRHAVARFMREMQVTARLEHAATVRVYDFGEADLEGAPLFLVMELVAGRTLGAVIEEAQGPMAPARVVAIGQQIARALEAAHGEGIVHRDLKPDNVMLVDRYGQRDAVKVLDFGIARFIEGAEGEGIGRLTAEGAVVGTPAYMSPEQATGAALGPASDLYSLGVMLFEMATGVVPFSAPTTVSLMVKHVQEPPPRPSALAELPAGLEALILACLEKDPERRPGSAREVAERLEAIAVGAGASAGGAGASAGGAGAGARVASARAEEEEALGPARRGARAWVWVATVVGIGAVAGIAAVISSGASGSGGAGGEGPAPHVEAAARLEVASERSGGADGVVRVAEVAAAAASEPDDPDAEPAAPSAACAQAIARAREALATGREEAGSLARAGARACETWAVAHVAHGLAAQKEAAWDEAREAFSRAETLAPTWGVPRFDRALIELAADRPAQARAILTELIAIAPAWPDAHVLRAQAALRLGDFGAARSDAETATRLFPTRPEGWFLLGESHRALGASGSAHEATRAYCRAKELGMSAAAGRCGASP